ncbi:MAG: DNA starvation/stationary phase protection protein [Actinobacteria bacterium]|nr:DNA starvation/stationary phase protection protein [Actinomycetota bacterium]
MEIDIGIDDEARTRINGTLERLLADTYTLYLKTQNYHWNVTGPMFRALHLMFEEQYIELRDAVDEIAERIRSLGFVSPGSFAEFSGLTQIAEGKGTEDAMQMVRNLAEGHEAAARRARAVVEEAEPAGDVATADLATVRIETHEKTAWMLRATAS